MDSQATTALFPGLVNCTLRVIPRFMHDQQEAEVNICFRYNIAEYVILSLAEEQIYSPFFACFTSSFY